jgi:hypothetical protein
MSDYQKTMIKFMQVKRAGTQEQWRKGLSWGKEIDEIKELAIMHPLRIKQRKRESDMITSKNKYIVQPTEEILILCVITASCVTFTL